MTMYQKIKDKIERRQQYALITDSPSVIFALQHQIASLSAILGELTIEQAESDE